MAIGSFLASAGRIGTGIEQYQTDSELRRLQRLQAELARGQLARQEQFRQLQLEAPVAELPEQGLMLGAPLQVAEPEFAPAGQPAAGLLPPAPPTTEAPPAAGAGAGAAKPTARVMKIGGVTIPRFDSRKPDRLNAGVAGFERLDPNASDFVQNRTRRINEDQLDYRLSVFANEIDPTRGSTGARALFGAISYFAPQDAKQRAEQKVAASSWYRSDNAREYFRRNPEMLTVAEKNPVEFFKGLMRYNQMPITPAPAAAAAGVTPPVVAKPAQARLQAINEAIASIPANDPFRRIIGLEGGFNTRNGTFNTSPAGAIGPAQLMPGTAPEAMELAGFARNDNRWRTDPRINIMAGRAYYNMLLRRYNGDPVKAAAAYNAGPGNMDRALTKASRSGLPWQDHLPAAETRKYVQDFVANTGRATRFLGGEGAALAATGAAPAAAGTPQMAAAAPTPVPVRIDPSNFYLANPNATSRDVRIAMQNRQELARMAEMYRQAGMGSEFTAARLKVIELDNSLMFLQGMQGLQELALANDPRRLAAVWSDYAGVPVQLQPQTDGSFNVLVNGRVTQRGVARSAIIDAARSSFDQQYVATQSAAQAEMNTEFFKSQLRMTEEAAKTAAKFAADVQLELLKGDNARATEMIKQMDPNGRITMLPDGSGQAILQVQGQTLLIDKGGVQIEGAPEGMVSGPSARPIAGLPQRTVGVGTGG